MNNSTTTSDWLTPEVREHLRRVEYAYQVREFGEEMARIKLHERAVRPYMVAVKRDARSDAPDLKMQHDCRVEHAEKLLVKNPMRDFGIDQLIAQAKADAAKFVPAGALDWLPDVRGSFTGLGT